MSAAYDALAGKELSQLFVDYDYYVTTFPSPYVDDIDPNHIAYLADLWSYDLDFNELDTRFTYEWDLDGDGQYDDAVGRWVTIGQLKDTGASFITPAVRVNSQNGAYGTASGTFRVNHAPVPIGIEFSADPEDFDLFTRYRATYKFSDQDGDKVKILDYTTGRELSKDFIVDIPKSLRYDGSYTAENRYREYYYRLSDGYVTTDVVIDRILIPQEFDPIKAKPIAASVDQDGALAIEPFKTAVFIDGSYDTYKIGSASIVDGKGSVSFDGTKINFDPNGMFDALSDGESATVKITYSLDSGYSVAQYASGTFYRRDFSGSTSSTITVTVSGKNDAPVATPVDLGDGVAGSTYTITPAMLLTGASDVDGDALSLTGLTITSGPGSIEKNADGTYAYRAPQGAGGTVLFSYTVSDGTLSASSTAELLLPSRNAPTTGGVTLTVLPGGALPTLSASHDLADADVPDLTVTWQWRAFASDGTARLIPGATAATFTPDATYAGRLLQAVASYVDADVTVSVGSRLVIGLGTSGGDTMAGGTTSTILLGFGGDDVLTGSADDDTLDGGWGLDRLFGADGDDSLRGDGGDDQLFGGAGLDTLFGGDGDDRLDGGGDDDVLSGGNGSDTLLGGLGRDRLSGGGERDSLDGGEGDDTLFGQDGSDILIGGGGADGLYGDAGNDTLQGDAGNDRLDGGSGADLMVGGAGDDTYLVDHALDTIRETPNAQGGGYDTVFSSVSLLLADDVEALTLVGTASATATGNALDNRIKGNAGDNVLSGGGGRDILTGGAGGDTFLFANASASSQDRVTDFDSAEGDLVGLSAAGFGLKPGSGLVDSAGGSTLDPTWFAAGSGLRQGTAAHGQFLFDTASNTLFFDADGLGTGKAVALAQFNAAVGYDTMLVV